MQTKDQGMYVIPARYRKMENLHIVFWLLKDISWCMIWKTLGLLMIVPTLSVAVYIAWRTREIKSELAHNLAIVFWITANSYWMISEFFGFDDVHVYAQLAGKHVAIIPFGIGILILTRYYLFVLPKEIKQNRMATM